MNFVNISTLRIIFYTIPLGVVLLRDDYIDESERGNELGNYLMSYAEDETRKLGFSKINLTTDHNKYHEKYGWIRIVEGYEVSGEPTRIYMKEL